MYRMANFFISKNLGKAEKMPNFHQWKVSENDRSVEGPILLYLRAKGWFFDHVCQPGIRYCVLTKRGFLLIYMKETKGFVLDIRRAFEIKTLSDTVSVLKTQYRRCRLKIRYNFGTVNIILTNGKIDLWRDRLLNAAGAPSTMAITRQLSLPQPDSGYVGAKTPLPASWMYGPIEDVEIPSPSLVALKSFPTATSTAKEVSEKAHWAKVKTPFRDDSEASVFTALDVSTCDDDYQCLSSRLPQIDEEPSVAETSTSGLFNYDSIRESTIPVGWLRRQLEHKIDASRRRPVFVATPTTPIDGKAEVSSATASPVDDDVTLTKSIELPSIPLPSTVATTTSVSKAPKVKNHAKFSKKRRPHTPVQATARSVPSDSSSGENTRYNSFQFWRSSYESDV